MNPSALEALHNALGGVVSGPSRDDSEALAEQLEDSGWTLCPTVEAAGSSSPESPFGTPQRYRSVLSGAQRRALGALIDGEWHRGCVEWAHGRVLNGPGAALVSLGLAERRGESRTASPSNPGYQYRITAAGRSAAEPAGASSATREDEA